MKTTPKKNGGFTLVELIVVIAILAILAAVAIPAYSGYIAKAEKAGDLQLLGAINTAFASACMAEGVQTNEVKSAVLTWSENGKSVVGISSVDGATNAAIDAAFKLFYQGNEASEFKALAGNLAFDSLLHMFVDATNGVNVMYKDTLIVIDSADIQAYKNSVWGNVSTSNVLGLVGGVTGVASEAGKDGTSDVYTEMTKSPAYVAACAAALGYDTVEEYQQAVAQMAQTAVNDFMAKNPEATTDEIDAFSSKYIADLSANTAVFVASKNAAANSGTIIEKLTENDGKNAKDYIKNSMKSDNPADGLAQASLAYGLYTSYQLKLDPTYDTTKQANPIDVMHTLDDPEFQKYLNSDQAQKDLDGFMGALNTANSNSGNGVGLDIVQNGFATNEDLAAMLQQAMGK